MNGTTATAVGMGTEAPVLGTAQALAGGARSGAVLAGRWRAVTGRLRQWPPPVQLEVGPELPQRFGDHYRWPDGTWHHCC